MIYKKTAITIVEYYHFIVLFRILADLKLEIRKTLESGYYYLLLKYICLRAVNNV